jgi:hypothetical protein
LLSRVNFPASELDGLQICPVLDMYRDQVGLLDLLPAASDIVATSELLTTLCPSSSSRGGSGGGGASWLYADSDAAGATAATAAAAGGGSGGYEHDQQGGAGYDDYDDNNDHTYGGDGDDGYDNGFEDSSAAAAATPTAAADGGGDAEGSKLRWADLVGSSNSNRESLSATQPSSSDIASPTAADAEAVAQSLELISGSGFAGLQDGTQEYSYFDTSSSALFSSSNAWAGARHWKYATRKRTATAAASTAAAPLAESSTALQEEDEEEAEAMRAGSKAANGRKKTTAGAKKTTKKDKSDGILDFSAGAVDEALFDLPAAAAKGKTKKAAADPTVLTAAALAKQESAAPSLLLPPDAKVQVKDMCKLYLAPQMIIPASERQRAQLSAAAAASSSSGVKQRSGSCQVDKFLGGLSGCSERVWGLAGPAQTRTIGLFGADTGALGAAGGIGGGDSSGGGNNNDYGGDDDDDGDMYGGDYGGGADDDFDGAPSGNAENISPAADLCNQLAGLNINQSGLLQVERKVEKIDIG